MVEFNLARQVLGVKHNKYNKHLSMRYSFNKSNNKKSKIMKKEVKTRSITGTKAVKYAELANKMVMLNLVSPEERRQYFDAIYALRELADKYCNIHGLEII